MKIGKKKTRNNLFFNRIGGPNSYFGSDNRQKSERRGSAERECWKAKTNNNCRHEQPDQPEACLLESGHWSEDQKWR